jgi:hypothetical protein
MPARLANARFSPLLIPQLSVLSRDPHRSLFDEHGISR